MGVDTFRKYLYPFVHVHRIVQPPTFDLPTVRAKRPGLTDMNRPKWRWNWFPRVQFA